MEVNRRQDNLNASRMQPSRCRRCGNWASRPQAKDGDMKIEQSTREF
jgi:hypothetical protein